jgi:hypothetical protein
VGGVQAVPTAGAPLAPLDPLLLLPLPLPLLLAPLELPTAGQVLPFVWQVSVVALQ